MRARRKGDPIKAIREAVDNSLMGRLFGFGDSGPASAQDRIPQYDPNRSVYDVDAPGLPSTFDAALENLTPLGDIAALIASGVDAKEGNYLSAALAPLFMVLPQAMQGRLRGLVKEIGDLRMSNLTPDQQRLEITRIMGDMDQLGREAVTSKAVNPVEYDQAMREVARGLPDMDMSSAHARLISGDPQDVAGDALLNARQRTLGYSGVAPLRSEFDVTLASYSPENIGRIPISRKDLAAADLLEGAPSHRGVAAATMHQGSGSTPGTGLLAKSDMQRLAEDIPLVRTPIHGRPYRVIRDGQEQMVKAGQLKQGDVITSLSQKSSAGREGTDRLVSTSSNDLKSNVAAFGEDPFDGMPPDMDMTIYDAIEGDMLDPSRPSFKIVNTKGLPVTRADQYKTASGPGSVVYKGEDEFGVSALQRFNVEQVGLQEDFIPYVLLTPNNRKRYQHGGKFRILKR